MVKYEFKSQNRNCVVKKLHSFPKPCRMHIMSIMWEIYNISRDHTF